MPPRLSRRLTLGLATGSLGLLAFAATASVHPLSSAAAGCGAAAADVYGKFVANRTARSGAKEVLTVIFSSPNTVTSDEEATLNGQPAGSAKGTGTFKVGPPLTWTDSGTTTDPGKPGYSYADTFTASAGGVKCTTGTTVSSITGTWTESKNRTDTETYTRQP